MGSVLVGDCREVLPTLGAGSVDAVVTDPPYGLGFMGKGWDRPGVAFDPATWAAVLRVLVPGGSLLAFGGTRTWHRLACAIEDGGFEVKDTLMWLHGQGFPKGKGLLKPAWEPVLLARKQGKATLNVEACRIDSPIGPGAARVSPGNGRAGYEGGWVGCYHGAEVPSPESARHDARGRWPANVCLDEEAAALLDAEAGERRVGVLAPHHRRNVPRFGSVYRDDEGQGASAGHVFGGDSGGPSRFYYVAKASRSEREAGLGGMPLALSRNGQTHHNGQATTRMGRTADEGQRPAALAANHHPTVKPVALMRWLVRLVTPPGGLVLDPFAGSGSTGVACVLEGLRFAGIEQDAEYAEIARRRVAHAAGPLLAEVANGG